MSLSFEEQLQNNLNVFKQKLENLSYTSQNSIKPVNIDFTTESGKVLYSFINAFTLALYNKQKNQDYIFRQFFPQTANTDYLKYFHASTWGVNRLTSTPSTGYVIFLGEEGGIVSQGTQISANGKIYITNDTLTILKTTIKVKSITKSNTRAIVVLNEDYKMGSGMTLNRIYGANETQYNKENVKITAIGTNTFSYDIEEDYPETVTGDIYVEFISGSVLVKSYDSGSNTKLINGTTLKMTASKVGVNDECYVYYDGIVGGKDTEDELNFKNRILKRIRGLPQGWNKSNIEISIRNFQYGKYNDSLIFIPRAEKTDGEQKSGYTTIYMLKKDLTLLSNTEQNDIKNYLVDTIYKINPTEEQVNVVNPSLKEIEIKVSLINNTNTTSMKTAIEETIKYMQNNENVCWFRKNLTKKTVSNYLDQVMDENGILLEDNYNLTFTDHNLEYNEFPILSIKFE